MFWGVAKFTCQRVTPIEKAVDPLVQHLLNTGAAMEAVALAVSSKIIYSKLPDKFKTKVSRPLNYIRKVLDRVDSYSIGESESFGAVPMSTFFRDLVNSPKMKQYRISIPFNHLEIIIDFNAVVNGIDMRVDAAIHYKNQDAKVSDKATITLYNDLNGYYKITFDFVKLTKAFQNIRSYATSAGRQPESSKYKYKNRSYKVHTGSRGGKYIVVQGQKIYVKP